MRGQAAAEWLLRIGLGLPWLGILGLCAAAFMIASCTKSDEAEKPQERPAWVTQKRAIGGVYRRPLGNDPASLDPARITDFYAVTIDNQIFDSLVEFDAHLNVMPALAQSWSASRDGLVWTFNLRQGVKFHNGREMTADDVVYSISRLLDPAVKSPRSWFLEKVKGAAEFQAGAAKALEGIRAPDRYTVQIALSEPFAPFISILGLPHLSIIPREEVERLGRDFAIAPVGTGPFRFVKWERGREIILEANEHYFRGRPALDRIRFVIFPGTPEGDMARAFTHGELEESPIPSDKRKELVEAGQYKVIRKPTLSIRLFGFNLEQYPFDKREVRRAFNHAIDKVRMNQEVQGGYYTVARGILPPGMPGYNPEVQTYSYDQDKAKDLLAQAGYTGEKGPPFVTFSTSANPAEVRGEFLAIQRFLGAIGIKVEFKKFDNWPLFRQALQQGDVQLFRYSWYADYPDPDNFLYPLFHSQSQTNYFRYRNPSVDKLLDDARRETRELQRVELYRKAEQLILKDAPAVFAWHFTYERVFQPYVEGVEVSALGDPYIPMRKIRLKPPPQASAKR